MCRNSLQVTRVCPLPDVQPVVLSAGLDTRLTWPLAPCIVGVPVVVVPYPYHDGSPCGRSHEVGTKGGIGVYLFICIRAGLGLAGNTSLTPVHSFGITIVHVLTDGEAACLSRSQHYLVLPVHLVPSFRAVIREYHTDAECLGKEIATFLREGNSAVHHGCVGVPCSASLFVAVIGLVAFVLCCGGIDEGAILSYLTSGPVFDEYTHLSLVGGSRDGDGRTRIGLSCHYVGVCTAGASCKGSSSVECHQRIAVFISTLEGDAAIGSTSVGSPLSLAQGRHSLTYLVEPDEVLCQVVVECGCSVTAGRIFTKVARTYITRKVTSEVGTPCVGERAVGAVVYL